MAHIHNLVDYVNVVFIVYQDKVLLIHHLQLNKWLPIGGHIELNEDPDQALLREVEEECGLEVEVLGKKPQLVSPGTKFLYTPAFLDIHDISKTHRHVGLVYFAKSKSDQVKLAEREHKDIKWFTKEMLDDPLYNLSVAVKFYAKEALRRVK